MILNLIINFESTRLLKCVCVCACVCVCDHFEALDIKGLKCRLCLNPSGNYMFKVNNRNTRTTCDMCSKLTTKTPEQCHGIVLVLLLLTLNIFHTLS